MKQGYLKRVPLLSLQWQDCGGHFVQEEPHPCGSWMGNDAVHQDSLQDTKSYSESGTLMMGGEKDDLFSEARLLHF